MNLGFDDFDNIDAIMSESATEPMSMDVGFPSVKFTKKFVSEFARMCEEAQKFGNDVYTKSFLLSRSGADTVELTYSNSIVYAYREVPIDPTENQLSGDFVIDFRSFAKVFTLPGPSMLLFNEEGTLYTRVFGGDVFLPVMNVVKDPYKIPDAGQQISSFTIEAPHFVELLKRMLILSKTGTRATERAVYFDNKNAYIYSGAVVGQFGGEFTDLVLQNNDIELIIRFFSLTKGEIEVEVCEKYVIFRTGRDFLMVQKKTLELPQAAKNPVKVDYGLRLDSKILKEIIKILEAIPTNSGVVDFRVADDGLEIEAPSRIEGKISKFSILGDVVGTGMDKHIRVSLKLLKNYMNAFDNEILFSFVGGRITIVGEQGAIMIVGLQEK